MASDSDLLAAEAGLSYVTPDSPGFRRVRRGRGFSYQDRAGRAINGKVRKRIESLVIPPAWEDVWISTDQQAHILATGVDKAGRKQYIYHPAWEEIRDEVKFDRLAPFGERLPRLRQRVENDLRVTEFPREKVVALAVAVLDRTLVRVGNRRYAENNDSYGLTTLRADHIETDGSKVHIAFTSKGGADHQVAFSDRRLARLISECVELGGETLLSYETPGGETSSILSGDVNRYLEEASGMPFTAKDFRTWGASALVTRELGSADGSSDDPSAVLAAIDVAADALGNTREVCRSSYVHPAVLDAHASGTLSDVWRRARPGRWLDRPESALRMVLRSS